MGLAAAEGAAGGGCDRARPVSACPLGTAGSGADGSAARSRLASAGPARRPHAGGGGGVAGEAPGGGGARARGPWSARAPGGGGGGATAVELAMAALAGGGAAGAPGGAGRLALRRLSSASGHGVGGGAGAGGGVRSSTVASGLQLLAQADALVGAAEAALLASSGAASPSVRDRSGGTAAKWTGFSPPPLMGPAAAGLFEGGAQPWDGGWAARGGGSGLGGHKKAMLMLSAKTA
jgi:hypothetical protein